MNWRLVWNCPRRGVNWISVDGALEPPGRAQNPVTSRDTHGETHSVLAEL